MTIKRTINDVEIEIELTEKELVEAYCEQENMWDIKTCSNYFDGLYSYEAWYDKIDDETKTNIIEDAAREYRRNINKYEMSHQYAIDYAFNEVIGNYIDENDYIEEEE